MSFEAVEFIDPWDDPGVAVDGNVLATFDAEDDAIAVARTARQTFLDSGRRDYAWWIVRVPGMTLARWIADSSFAKEFVLDLRTGELVEY